MINLLFFIIINLIIANSAFANNNLNKNQPINKVRQVKEISLDRSVKQDFIIASVNNKIITLFDAKNRYFIAKEISRINLKSPEEELLFRQLIDKMIEEELIKQIAQDLKITVSKEEIEKQIELDNLAFSNNSIKFINNIIKKNIILFESYKNQIYANILWNKIIEYHLKKNIKVSDSEIIERIEQDKINIDNQKILIEQINIPFANNKLDAQKLANKIYQQLKIGADFIEIKHQFSSEIASNSNDNIGWVMLNDLSPNIANNLKNLDKGGYSQVIEGENSYYIFKLVDRKNSQELLNETQQQQIYNIIFNNKITAMAKYYLTDLKKRAFIEIANFKVL